MQSLEFRYTFSGTCFSDLAHWSADGAGRAGLRKQIADLGSYLGFDILGAMLPAPAHRFLKAVQISFAGGTVAKVAFEVSMGGTAGRPASGLESWT